MGRVPAFISLFSLLFLYAMTMADPAGEPEGAAVALPASLDALYPPKAKSPLLLQGMYQLNTALTGIVIDLFEDDRQGVMENYESFRSGYLDNARLVPEWEGWYPTEPVDALGRVVENGSPDDVMAAVEAAGAACHACHLATMVPVQQRYRWPDFGTVIVTDPIRKIDVPYSAFMQMLNASLTGIQLDLGQGQPERARTHLDDLIARMAVLEESCEICHDTERAYYIDGGTDQLISRMDEILATPAFDVGSVLQMSRKLGEESCSRCHLVHLPAAYAQVRRR